MVATNNGTVTINGSTATYEPTQDWNGTDTFTYLANDGTEDSNTATVTITVNAVNDAPVTQNVSFTTDETLHMLKVILLMLVTLMDNLTITTVTDPTNGTATCDDATNCTYTLIKTLMEPILLLTRSMMKLDSHITVSVTAIQ